MNLKNSHVKKRLRNGGICFGTMLRLLKSPQSVALCASEGWDYIILDTEHNDYDLETLGTFSVVAKYEELGLFVRVPDKLYYQMAQMLDVGVEGLVLPQVKTPSEAQHILSSTKYAPLGKRGVSISATATLFRNYDVLTYTKWANEELMNIVQIESREGVENIEAILAIGGIDAIMIGPADLTMEMGIPGQFEETEVVQSYRKIIECCNDYGVAPGIHLQDFKSIERWVKEGMRFITYSYDTKLLKEVYRDTLSVLRKFGC